MTDVTDATFSTAVLDRSEQVPVVVDLWAPWCGPCRTLTPLLDAAVGATGGRAELVKVNVDENPQIAADFAVQSIPAVFAVSQGRVVDHFIGALPQKSVEEFVQRLVADAPATARLAGADEETLRAALDEDPGDEEAVVALARLLVASDRGAEALELLARIPETPEVRRLAAQARIGARPSADDVDAELRALLPDVKTDEEARRRFVDLLEVLGPDDPRTGEWRRTLAAQLF